jgi:hypothetical protein
VSVRLRIDPSKLRVGAVTSGNPFASSELAGMILRAVLWGWGSRAALALLLL